MVGKKEWRLRASSRHQSSNDFQCSNRLSETSQLAIAIDATPPPHSPEQQSNTMGNTSVASVPAPPRSHSGPNLRVQQQQQCQQTITVNPQELINMNQSQRLHQSATRPPLMTPPGKTPTGLTTLLPFHLKLQNVSGIPKKITTFVTALAATGTTTNGTRRCGQERVKVKEKTDSLIISFKNPPSRTDGASTKELVKSLAVAKTDDTQPTQPTQPTPCTNDRSRFHSSTIATATRRKTLEPDFITILGSGPQPDIESNTEPGIKSDPELEVESEVETGLETEELGGQGSTRGGVAERWIVDAMVIPIPRWVRYYRRR